MGRVSYKDKVKLKESGLPAQNAWRDVDSNEVKDAINDNDDRITDLEGVGLPTSDDVSVNTTPFNKNLSSADTDVQKALETIDQMEGGSGGGTALSTITDTTSFNKNLSASDTDVQKALQTFNDADLGGGTGGGDMYKTTYDPNLVEGDAFDMANMVEGVDANILTDAEKAEITANTAKVGITTQQAADITTNKSGVADLEASQTVQDGKIANLEASQSTGSIAKQTLAEIQALTPDVDTLYYVLDDPDPTNNGQWGWDGVDWYQGADTVNSGTFDDTNNLIPATQKSTADWVSDFDIDNLRELKDGTLNNYLVSDKETIEAQNIGGTAQATIWREGQSGLNFTAFVVRVEPLTDITLNKLEVYASHLISYGKINKNVTVRLYEGITYDVREPLWSTGTLIFEKSISDLEYYINVLQGDDDTEIKAIINADTEKEQIVPFQLDSEYTLTAGLEYTLYFGVDDEEIFTSPSTYSEENQVGISSSSNTEVNVDVRNPIYFNKISKWQVVSNPIPFKFILAEEIDYKNDATKEQLYDEIETTESKPIKETAPISENITRLNTTLSTGQVWKETTGGGLSAMMVKATVLQDMDINSVGFGALKFDVYTPKEINVICRVYKNVTFTGNNPDFSTGELLGESVIEYERYYREIVKGADSAEFATKYNADTDKNNEIEFAFDNTINAVTNDILTIVFTGEGGNLFEGGLGTSQLLGLYSVDDYQSDFINVSGGYYITPNVTSWYGISYKIPFSLNSKKSLKNYVVPLTIPNNTEIATDGSKQHIRSKLEPFFDSLKSIDFPSNICLIGSSISNIQSFGTELTYDESNLPICMYNTDTYSSNLWQFLNKGALNQDYSLRSNVGNMEFVKFDHPTKVAKTGTWQSNWNGTTDTTFSSSGGSSKGRHEFYYSKDKGNYIEFTIGADNIGFSVVCDKFNDTRTDGTTPLKACNSVKISVDGIEVGSVSIEGSYTFENTRFDYQLTPNGSDRVIRIENTEVADSWLNIHGIEAWQGEAVRIINTAVNGGSTATISSWFNYLVTGTSPDLVVFEHTMLNDMTKSIETVEQDTKNVFDKLQALGVPVLILITHITSRGSNNASDITSWEDYPLNTTIKYNLALPNLVKKLCAEYDFPFIDVAQYLYDKDGLSFNALNYTYDGTHLKLEGHNVYKYLNEKIIKF